MAQGPRQGHAGARTRILQRKAGGPHFRLEGRCPASLAAEPATLLFTNGEQASGPVHITPDRVKIGGATPSEQPRERLGRSTPGGSQRERDHWSGNASSASLCVPATPGDYEYNGQAHLQRRTPATRLSLDYIGNPSPGDGIEGANNHRANTEFDLWLSKRSTSSFPAANITGTRSRTSPIAPPRASASAMISSTTPRSPGT